MTLISVVLFDKLDITSALAFFLWVLWRKYYPVRFFGLTICVYGGVGKIP